MARKHSDTKLFLLGVAAMLATWAVGIFASGILPLIVDYVDVSEGYPTLSFLYPFMLVIYSAVFSAVCKRESKDAMFFGFYLFLAVPTAVYLLLVLYSYLDFEFLDYIPLIWVPLMLLAAPAMSVAEGFMGAIYKDIWPEGFTKVDIVFCATLFVATVLPPIIYKFAKSKQKSVL